MSLMYTGSSAFTGDASRARCRLSKFLFCCSFCLSSCSLTEGWFGRVGWRLVGSMGIFVLSFLFMSSSLGDSPLRRGVALYKSRAVYGSVAFFSNCFTVLTALSASPLLSGYLGELGV